MIVMITSLKFCKETGEHSKRKSIIQSLATRSETASMTKCIDEKENEMELYLKAIKCIPVAFYKIAE